MITASDKGLNVIRSYEGRALRAYQDSVGVWTIGYGNTNADANAVRELGKIGPGLCITAEKAESLFVESIRNQYEPAVFGVLGATPAQGVWDAAVSFHYNTGAIKKASWPKAYLAGNMALVKESMLSWNRAGSSVLAGLTRRRNREWLMLSAGDYGPEGGAGPVDLDSRVPGLLQAGDSGPKVQEVNRYLTQLQWLQIDQLSNFTPWTEAAVRAYQAAHPNLTKDGKVGPATLASLQRDVKMRMAASKTAVATVGFASVGSAAAGFGWLALKTALLTAGLVGATGLFFIVLNHRTELQTLWNTLTGNKVP
jgi:lysozyme